MNGCTPQHSGGVAVRVHARELHLVVARIEVEPLPLQQPGEAISSHSHSSRGAAHLIDKQALRGGFQKRDRVEDGQLNLQHLSFCNERVRNVTRTSSELELRDKADEPAPPDQGWWPEQQMGMRREVGQSEDVMSMHSSTWRTVMCLSMSAGEG